MGVLMKFQYQGEWFTVETTKGRDFQNKDDGIPKFKIKSKKGNISPLLSSARLSNNGNVKKGYVSTAEDLSEILKAVYDSYGEKAKDKKLFLQELERSQPKFKKQGNSLNSLLLMGKAILSAKEDKDFLGKDYDQIRALLNRALQELSPVYTGLNTGPNNVNPSRVKEPEITVNDLLEKAKKIMVDETYSHLNLPVNRNGEHVYEPVRVGNVQHVYEPVDPNDKDLYESVDRNGELLYKPAVTTNHSQNTYSHLNTSTTSQDSHEYSHLVRSSRADGSPVASTEQSVSGNRPLYTQVKTRAERDAEAKKKDAEAKKKADHPSTQSYEQHSISQPPPPPLYFFPKHKNPESQALQFKEGIYANTSSVVPKEGFSWSGATADVNKHKEKVECLDLSSLDSLKIIAARHYEKSPVKNMRGITEAIFQQIDAFYTKTMVPIVLNSENLCKAVLETADDARYKNGTRIDRNTLKQLIEDELGERKNYVRQPVSESHYENVLISRRPPK